jgi:plastocyanin
MKTAPVLLFLSAVSAVATVACRNNDDLTSVRPGTVFVAARDSFFQPDTITIAVGIPVRWTNAGTVYHTVVSDSGLWGSSLLSPTWWFEVRFDSAGTFPYHCSQHDSTMTGTVIVQ